MGSPLIVALVSVTIGFGVLAVLLLGRVPRELAAAAADVPREAARRMTVPRWAGVTGGVLAGVVAARSGGLGTGLLIAAPLFGRLIRPPDPQPWPRTAGPSLRAGAGGWRRPVHVGPRTACARSHS